MFPPKLENALKWWVQILETFPSRTFKFGVAHQRPLVDVFTDASAESRWEGLGGVVFRGSRYNAFTVRVDDTPPCLEPFLPSKQLQSVRIAQLEMSAILIVLRVCGPRLQGTYCRIQVDNISAMYACLNAYSSNSFMARLAGEIWLELLQCGTLARGGSMSRPS